jgi:hypothetical protein
MRSSGRIVGLLTASDVLTAVRTKKLKESYTNMYEENK